MSWGKALQGCDAVVHIALGWGNTPVEMLDHDTRVTAFLAEAAERAGVKNFVYTSSTAAMGQLLNGMDETALLIPGDLYGATKASSEMYLIGFNHYYGGQGVPAAKVGMRRNIIRPGYTFSNPAYEGGASQSDVRFKNICLSILKNEDVTFSRYDGTQFLSSGQIAELYVKLVESDLNKEIFLALGKKFVSWVDIANMAKELVPASTGNVIDADAKVTKELFLLQCQQNGNAFSASPLKGTRSCARMSNGTWTVPVRNWPAKPSTMPIMSGECFRLVSSVDISPSVMHNPAGAQAVTNHWFKIAWVFSCFSVK